jgi:hypothetical protein
MAFYIVELQEECPAAVWAQPARVLRNSSMMRARIAGSEKGG